MSKRKFPKGLRKYIRKEKALIRREVLDVGEQKEKIDELYKKLFERFIPQEKIEKPKEEEKTAKKIKTISAKPSESDSGEESKKKTKKEKEKNAKNKKIRK